MFVRLGSFALVTALLVVVGGSAVGGALLGRRLRERHGAHRESVGVIQGTLLGFLGLLLAFGLTMAVGRYDARRATVVEEANDIGTTFLRAQLLTEPLRSEEIDLLREYADVAVSFAGRVPDGAGFRSDADALGALQRRLWSGVGRAVAGDPDGTAPRLFAESVNATIDTHTQRVASLRNRVPGSVMWLQVVGGAVSLGVLAFYLALLGRGPAATLLAAGVVVLILVISFDLDRPQHGFIRVPSAPLVDVRNSLELPAAAGG